MELEIWGKIEQGGGRKNEKRLRKVRRVPAQRLSEGKHSACGSGQLPVVTWNHYPDSRACFSLHRGTGHPETRPKTCPPKTSNANVNQMGAWPNRGKWDRQGKGYTCETHMYTPWPGHGCGQRHLHYLGSGSSWNASINCCSMKTTAQILFVKTAALNKPGRSAVLLCLGEFMQPATARQTLRPCSAQPGDSGRLSTESFRGSCSWASCAGTLPQ